MSAKNPNPSETVTDPAAIAARIQSLSPAFKTGWRLGFDGHPCDLPDCVARDSTAQHLEDFNEGHRQGRIARAKELADTTDTGSPAMLPEIDATTRTIMAGNGVVEDPEQFDEFTGPGIPATSRSIGVAGVSPHSAAPKAAAGGEAFRLSENQRASIREMAIRCTAMGNFDVLYLSIESLVLAERVAQLNRDLNRVDAAIRTGFARADQVVRDACKVAKCNACPKCGKELEYTPAEPETNTAGGYDCSDPDCGYSCGLEGGAANV